jgi:4-amino-4-deoxy-L-arabinose transferase-like glycosyltransferase
VNSESVEHRIQAQDFRTVPDIRSPLERLLGGQILWIHAIVIVVAAVIYLGCIISPPSLQDDVDAVQAQIARNMLQSGDWVTARLDGIPYLEKAPLIYWMIAGSYKLFGVSDWSARIPVALGAIGLAWVTMAFGIWAFGRKAGFYAGICMSTCVGVFLFTRVQIPDVILTFTITLAMWSFLRALDERETRPRIWGLLFWVNLGFGLLLKSLIGILFPLAAGVIYLLLTRQFFVARTWNRLRPFAGIAIALLIAAPWHILATLRNPPYFDFTMHSEPGQYHGFLWFFFINEQLLRFLNLRYPRDYNTVPRFLFWGFHLLWLFPWSVYLPGIAKLSYKPMDRQGMARLLALCWIGFVLVFFTFSTTQEYYSMPAYPAFALLIGCVVDQGGSRVRNGTRVLTVISGLAAIAVLGLWWIVRATPAPGDISSALSQRPGTYTLSLGHMGDLTIASFAYLRLPLLVAAVAFLIGTFGTLRTKGQRAFISAALMMIVFFHAARLALVVFDPYLSSRELANALLKAPPGELIIDHHYYDFSSVFFYTDKTALLRNGRFNNLVYGSYAPGAPNVFVDDSEWKSLWLKPGRCYLVASARAIPKLEELVGVGRLTVVASSGGKYLLTNRPLQSL